MLEIDRASAGRMIDRMEKNGWVERRPDNGDRRINRLHLTADARKVHAEMWAIAESTVDDALSPLSADERDAIRRAHRQGEGPAAGAGRSRADEARTGRAAARPAGRRPAGGDRGRRVLVAVGRTLCQHRQCLCEGAYRADRAGNLGPGAPRAGARPPGGQRRRQPDDHRIAALQAGARQRRGRARRRAQPGRDAARHLARGHGRAGRRRGARRLLQAPVAAPGGARGQGHHLGLQARGVAERRAGRRRSRRPRCARSCSACWWR